MRSTRCGPLAAQRGLPEFRVERERGFHDAGNVQPEMRTLVGLRAVLDEDVRNAVHFQARGVQTFLVKGLEDRAS